MSIPNGGDVAEQIVKVSIDGAEKIIKLFGENAVQLAALIKALLENSNSKTPLGKTRLVNLVKDGHELSAFPIRASDRKRFEQIANDLKVPFCPLKSKSDPSECNILFRSSDQNRINEVLSKFNYKVIEKGDDDGKKKSPYPFEASSVSSSKEEVKTMTIEPPPLPKEAIQSNDLFKQYLMAQNLLMDRYSPRNQELIREVKPDASLVLGKRQWQELGRTINADARKIMISLPRFDEKTHLLREYAKVPVYDISDTVGSPVRAPSKASEKDTAALFQSIEEQSKTPIRQDTTLPNRALYNAQDGVISVQGDLDIQQKTCVVFREKAHEYLYQKQGESYRREENHFIATAIAFRLSEKFNIPNESLDFSKLLDTLKEKGLDEKQLADIMTEINSGYKALSKEIEIQKDAPQINAPTIKTEKER